MHTPLTPAARRAAKRQVVDNTPMRIGAIDFGIMSQDEIERQSQLEISDRNLYDLDLERNPTQNGPLDLKLGTSSKVAICKTCHQEQRSCNGHWGFVRLEAACFHIGFLAFTVEVLNQVCKTCSRVLLLEADRRSYLKSLRRLNLDSFQRRLILRRLQADCKKIRRCPNCDSSNGPVRKVAGHACKLVHLKFEFFHKSTAKNKKPPPDKERFDAALYPYTETNKDNARHVKKAVDDLPAVKVHRIFCAIPTEDCELLGLDLKKGRPESYLWTHLPVPPPNIRPSVPGDQGTTEDELTTKLSEIIDLNTRLRVAIQNEEHMSIQMDYYEKLQDHIAMYINSHAPGLNKSEYGKAIRSFCSRLKGKQGRFRGNLSGKRVNFSGRTVISPDPNLSIEEVGIPKHVCKILSFPQTVNDNKIARKALTQAIINGPSIWPGANGIKKKNGLHISLKVSATLGSTFVDKVIKELENGDVVHRHLINDDVVLFNRQPSLHKLSVLCHRVRVHDSRTFRFNESVCNPYNADFDGDEMNIHVPQTEEARAEALELMGVKHNLVTPKNGAPIIAPIQDFITASYLLSLKDLFFNKAQFSQIIGWMFDAQVFKDPITGELQGYELPPPSIMKPMYMWTGKQVFNVMIRPSRKSKVLINLEARLREYKPVAGVAPDMCLEDGYLIIRNSEIMCGKMDKKAIGDGNKSSLFSVLLRDYGTDYAVQCMNRLAKLSARWLAHQGFSIGIGDVYPSQNLQLKKQALTTTAEAAVNDLILKFSKGALERDAGCDAEQTLENKISKILSDVRNDAGAVCFEELSAHNAAVIMAKSGSKGSMINVSQMTAGVGQQMIGGARVENGFQDRTLPHFKKGARDSASKGFVSSSFFSGLNPTEFIFHAMSGREGLVDTAVKTAETGYMSRRLIKSLEDAYVVYDNTIRNSSGKIIQFCFGDDRLDPAELEGDKQPINFDRTMQHAIETEQDHDTPAMAPYQIMEATRRALAVQLKKFIPHSLEDIVKVVSDDTIPDDQVDSDQAYRKFIKDVHDFIDKRAIRLEGLRIHYRVDEETADEVSSDLPVSRDSAKTSNDDVDFAAGKEEEQSVPSRKGRKPKRGGKAAASGGTEVVPQADTKDGKASAQPPVGSTKKCLLKPWERFSPAQQKQRSVDNVLKITPAILNTFLQLCWTKYTKSIAQPAHAVGAIAAQSIGEPGTQMTLKTFHFAGVAGMSITGGVPRIKEIINAAKKISTPVISCALENKYSEQAARFVKSRIEKTYLREIAKYVEDEWSPNKGMLRLHIDMQRVSALQLDLNLHEIVEAIHKTKGLKINRSDIIAGGGNVIRIIPQEDEIDEADEMDIDGYISEEEAAAARGRGRRPKRRAGPGSYYQSLQELRRSILGVVVKGYPETARAIIRRSEKTNTAGQEELELLIEGYGLKACMNTEGVRGLHTKTNSVMETWAVLGVEAARSVIISEIQKVMESMDIDEHHIHLLACIMTLKGEVLGITRFGMAKMGDSVLQLASFEKTPDHLFEAATKMKADPISGVSESIIMGQTVKLGTGMASVFRPLGLEQHVGEKEPVFWTSYKDKRSAIGWGAKEWEIGNRLKTAVAAAPAIAVGA